jgi:hypothetical protein
MVQAIFLYHLFKSLNDDKSLTAQGIGAYLQLEELLADGRFLHDYEDFRVACETLLIKDKNEQPRFQAIFDDWLQQVSAYATTQYEAPVDIPPDIPAPEPIPPIPIPDPPDIPRRGPAPSASGNTPSPGTPATPENPGPLEPHTEPPHVVPDDPQTADGEITFSFGGQEATGESKKIQETGLDDKAASSRTFLFGNEYFPVGSRYLWQNWRNLRSRQSTSEDAGIDLKATIREIASVGKFIDFVMERKTRNIFSLFILLDQGGSMSTFEAFGEALVESACASGAYPDLTPLYFYNLPNREDDGYLVFNRDQTQSWTTGELFKAPNKNDILILIYSDAGALRGTTGKRKDTRIEETGKFLDYLLKNTAHIVWLNPTPANRWENTAAAGVAGLFPRIPMFEATPGGMEQAIHVLKGKPVLKR